MEDLDWYINQAGDDIHLIEKFGSDDAYDLYEPLNLDELAAPGAPAVVKGKKLDVSTTGVDTTHIPARGKIETHPCPTRCCVLTRDLAVLIQMLSCCAHIAS